MSSKFFRSARERVLSTAAQVAGALTSVELFIAQTGIGAEHWQRLTAYGVVATGLAVVKVLAAKKIGDPESGSLNGVVEGAASADLVEQVKELSELVAEVSPCDDCPNRDNG